ncbi:hypothetical protein PGTUg99_000030 [Puccinia graminis f. sp. tritici]|uniref:Uncharacterized protein n=1 Tax=Puccinia graminis f. sp. tritici TaxID=56615 RepID=A0A5B0NN84_PUCGR|nr:hypothetical protein PGTUg99_000030 [Puccinia graminis f. sp. tritici]
MTTNRSLTSNDSIQDIMNGQAEREETDGQQLFYPFGGPPGHVTDLLLILPHVRPHRLCPDGRKYRCKSCPLATGARSWARHCRTNAHRLNSERRAEEIESARTRGEGRNDQRSTGDDEGVRDPGDNGDVQDPDEDDVPDADDDQFGTILKRSATCIRTPPVNEDPRTLDEDLTNWRQWTRHPRSHRYLALAVIGRTSWRRSFRRLARMTTISWGPWRSHQEDRCQV